MQALICLLRRFLTTARLSTFLLTTTPRRLAPFPFSIQRSVKFRFEKTLPLLYTLSKSRLFFSESFTVRAYRQKKRPPCGPASSVLGSEFASAFLSSRFKNITSALCLHAFSKAVFFFSLSYFWLIGSFQVLHLLSWLVSNVYKIPTNYSTQYLVLSILQSGANAFHRVWIKKRRFLHTVLLLR